MRTPGERTLIGRWIGITLNNSHRTEFLQNTEIIIGFQKFGVRPVERFVRLGEEGGILLLELLLKEVDITDCSIQSPPCIRNIATRYHTMRHKVIFFAGFILGLSFRQNEVVGSLFNRPVVKGILPLDFMIAATVDPVFHCILVFHRVFEVGTLGRHDIEELAARQKQSRCRNTDYIRGSHVIISI